jgi:hypothetical protein
MPTVSGAQMAINFTSANNATIRVTFNVTFTPFERQLAQNGLVFTESIEVMGRDASRNQLLQSFPEGPSAVIPVPAPGAANATVPRERTLGTTRTILNEDSPEHGADEIRCRISIKHNFPLPQTAGIFTNEIALT